MKTSSTRSMLKPIPLAAGLALSAAAIGAGIMLAKRSNKSNPAGAVPKAA